jgi:hypothetical protein
VGPDCCLVALTCRCVTSSPLLLGFDVTKVSTEVLSIVTNKAAIDVNQQWAGFAGDRVWVHDGKQLEGWAKPLLGDGVAVVFFNRHNTTSSAVSVDVDTVGFKRGKASVTDVWTGTVTSPMGTSRLSVPQVAPHGSVFWLLRVPTPILH